MVVGQATYTFHNDKEGRRTDIRLTVKDAGPATTAHTHNDYDDSGRLTRTTTKRWERVSGADKESLVYDVSYCYAKRTGTQPCSTAKGDDTGLRQWQTEHHRGGVVQEYSYDKSNRLTTATNVGDQTFEYTYDSNGNRKTARRKPHTPAGSAAGVVEQKRNFNSANQITGGGYEYDRAGNQTNGHPTRKAAYNAAGHTTSFKTPDADTVTFQYAGADQVELTSMKTPEGTWRYTWGRNGQHGQAVLEAYDAPDTNRHFIERDGQGDPVGHRVKDPDGTNEHYFYVLDGLGSLVSVIDANGALVGHHTYDPYGAVLNTTAHHDVIGYIAIGYAGGLNYKNYTDFPNAAGDRAGAGELVKFGQRWYDPHNGRFTQQDNLHFIGDPANGNRYAYAGCNPTNYTDPTGLKHDDPLLDALDTGEKFAVPMGFVGAAAGCIIAALPTFGAGCPGGAVAGGLIGGGLGFLFGVSYYWGSH
jgi:RHS repeat-associated protein